MARTSQADLLRALPQVEEALCSPEVHALESLLPRTLLADSVRNAINEVRQNILTGSCSEVDRQAIAEDACLRALENLKPSLRRVINATGVIVHTNLGRSPLADEAVRAVLDVAQGYSTLEYNTDNLARGSRHDHIEHLLCTLTGAEAALAVNNNAAAVMMVLTEFAAGHAAVVSRGELVEIGGSFRIPDIMELSRATMVEVGTTNKTHVADYERAITSNTALLLKVHPSNYRLVGFTESVGVADLRQLADSENVRRHTTERAESATTQLLVYEDQGSGAFIRLESFGSYAEPTVAESLRAGCDLVSFSGDKLLGGPQAGIIVGSKQAIDRLKKNPLARALRLDKMTLAALEATLRLYLNPDRALQAIPTLRMLSESSAIVHARAERLAAALDSTLDKTCAHINIVPETARAGGGSLPMCDIDTFAVQISFKRGCAHDCEAYLASRAVVPIVGRIKKEALLLDARTLVDENTPEIVEALQAFFDSLCDKAAPSHKEGAQA